MGRNRTIYVCKTAMTTRHSPPPRVDSRPLLLVAPHLGRTMAVLQILLFAARALMSFEQKKLSAHYVPTTRPRTMRAHPYHSMCTNTGHALRGLLLIRVSKHG